MKLKSGFLGVLGVVIPFQSAATAAAIEVGGEYHFTLFNTDDGLNAESAQIKETDMAVRAAKIVLRGALSDQITWNVLYQADKSQLERYWLTNKLTDEFEVSIGQQKIKTYGWHRRLTSSATSPVRGAFLEKNPFKDVMSVDFAYKIAGTVSLTFVKDYFDNQAACTAQGTGCTSWNGKDVQKQPGIVFEWVGAFGPIQPLVQYTSYDRGHSNIVSAGLRFKTDVLDTYVDYTLDTRNAKGVVAGKAEDQENKYTGLVVYGEYKLGTFTPYLQYSTLESDLYAANGAAKKETNTDGTLDNNESTITGGVFFENYGSFYRPYAAVALYSGDFVDPDNTAAKEERSKTDLMLGLTGKF